MKRLFYSLLLIGLISSCQNDGTDLNQYKTQAATKSDAGYSPTSGNGTVSGYVTNGNQNKPKEQKIIWSGNIEYEVNNIDKATDAITKLVARYKGNITNLNLTKTYGKISNKIIIRISNKNFHGLINSLKSKAEVVDRIEIKSADVTEEFLDIQSRLKTKKEARRRYIEILRKKTGSIKDVIAAEEAIRVITEEIEAKEGRLRYLQNRVDLSTITIHIYQKIETPTIRKPHKNSYLEDISRAFGNGWNIIKNIGLLIVNIWPLLILVAGIIYLWRRKKRRQ